MSDLAEALTLRPDDGSWIAFADPRYESTNSMFGGWTSAIALLAVIADADPESRPSAITTNFIDAVPPGSEVRIRNRRLGGSRSISHWISELTSCDDGRTLAHATVVMTARRGTDGYVQATMPAAPDPDTLEEFHAPGTQGERSLIRPIVGHPPYSRSDTRSSSWVRELTGRDVDRAQLAFLADQFAPRPFFWSDGPRLSATLTMSVYFHATDDEIAAVGDDYVLSEAIASRGESSTCGQHALLWSRSGTLLATTEQLCWYR
jgi:acyl-CoA thioesterase